MTSPYDAARAAVAAYGAYGPAGSAGSSSAPQQRGPAPAVQVRLPAVATYSAVSGGLVATYPATPYPRLLRRLAVNCTSAVAVTIYVGAIADNARESSYGDGSRADFDPTHSPYIPEGAPVIIVWAGASTDSASCTATFEQVG